MSTLTVYWIKPLWSVAWGVSCALLFVLYVRSHHWIDGLGVVVSSDRYVTVMSANRRIQLSTATFFPAGQMRDQWSIGSRRLKDARLPPIEEQWGYQGILGFGYLRTPLFDTLAFPHWFPAVLIIAVAVLPWYVSTYRFSLRILLIATTLVAVMLGTIVWLSRAR